MESPDLVLCMNNLFCWKCNTQISLVSIKPITTTTTTNVESKTKRLARRMTAQPCNRFVFVSWSWCLLCNGNQAIAFMHSKCMADRIARKEGHRQLFVEYLNEIAHNSRDASFLSGEDFTEVAFTTIQSPENKNSLLTN